MLTHLIADLVRDTDLQQRFKKRPLEVLAEYDIPEETQGIAWSEDRKKVEEILAREAGQMLDQLTTSGSPFVYPNSQLTFDSIGPESGKVGKQIDVTVHGEYIGEGASLTFHRPGYPGSPVTATKVQVTDAYTDESVLTARVKLPQAGTYDVTVTNPDHEAKILPHAFTVT